jgi:hypothetical protein
MPLQGILCLQHVVTYESRVIVPASLGNEISLTSYHIPQPVNLEGNAFLPLLLLLLYLPLFPSEDGPRQS